MSVLSGHPAASLPTPRYAIWTAAAIPLLVLTGFGLITTIPVTIMAIAGLLDRRLTPLRPLIALTTGLFAGPFVDWLFRSDPGASLTSLLHPVMAVAIALAGLGTLAAAIWGPRRAAR